jgi:hypothetical protein
MCVYFSLVAACDAHSRCSLGAGLDRITSGFQEIVGNPGMGSTGIPCFISAAVIFIGFYALYSEESASEASGHRRSPPAGLVISEILRFGCSDSSTARVLFICTQAFALIRSFFCLFLGIVTSLSFSVRRLSNYLPSVHLSCPTEY